MKKAFTLIEVNLAMMVMAVGILAIVGLYAHGYRESNQSREDVEATALADHVISPLVMAITHTNMKWSVFRQGFHYPDNSGWGAYFDNDGIVSEDPDNRAKKAFADVMSQLDVAGLTPRIDTKFPLPDKSDGASAARSLSCGLVILHDEGSPLVRIAFRATRRPGTLLAMPIFYTEARFQGDPNK